MSPSETDVGNTILSIFLEQIETSKKRWTNSNNNNDESSTNSIMPCYYKSKDYDNIMKHLISSESEPEKNDLYLKRSKIITELLCGSSSSSRSNVNVNYPIVCVRLIGLVYSASVKKDHEAQKKESANNEENNSSTYFSELKDVTLSLIQQAVQQLNTIFSEKNDACKEAFIICQMVLHEMIYGVSQVIPASVRLSKFFMTPFFRSLCDISSILSKETSTMISVGKLDHQNNHQDRSIQLMNDSASLICMYINTGYCRLKMKLCSSHINNHDVISPQDTLISSEIEGKDSANNISTDIKMVTFFLIRLNSAMTSILDITNDSNFTKCLLKRVLLLLTSIQGLLDKLFSLNICDTHHDTEVNVQKLLQKLHLTYRIILLQSRRKNQRMINLNTIEALLSLDLDKTNDVDSVDNNAEHLLESSSFYSGKLQLLLFSIEHFIKDTSKVQVHADIVNVMFSVCDYIIHVSIPDCHAILCIPEGTTSSLQPSKASGFSLLSIPRIISSLIDLLKCRTFLHHNENEKTTRRDDIVCTHHHIAKWFMHNADNTNFSVSDVSTSILIHPLSLEIILEVMNVYILRLFILTKSQIFSIRHLTSLFCKLIFDDRTNLLCIPNLIYGVQRIHISTKAGGDKTTKLFFSTFWRHFLIYMHKCEMLSAFDDEPKASESIPHVLNTPSLDKNGLHLRRLCIIVKHLGPLLENIPPTIILFSKKNNNHGDRVDEKLDFDLSKSMTNSIQQFSRTLISNHNLRSSNSNSSLIVQSSIPKPHLLSTIILMILMSTVSNISLLSNESTSNKDAHSSEEIFGSFQKTSGQDLIKFFNALLWAEEQSQLHLFSNNRESTPKTTSELNSELQTEINLILANTMIRFLNVTGENLSSMSFENNANHQDQGTSSVATDTVKRFSDFLIKSLSSQLTFLYPEKKVYFSSSYHKLFFTYVYILGKQGYLIRRKKDTCRTTEPHSNNDFSEVGRIN